MKKHKIKSVMVTRIELWRQELITKEEMESYCKGEQRQKDSVNDDLESIFENIRHGKEPDERVETYFLPKLTEEEIELVERSERSYSRSFQDVSFTYDCIYGDYIEWCYEMEPSESDSKYVRGKSQRQTFVIENSSEVTSEILSDNSSEHLYDYKSRKFIGCCNCSLQ